MIKDNYSLLIEKLDEFIRKYYVNQLLRGALYTVGAVLGLFILLNLLEYYFYFDTGVRTAMLWSFGLTSAAALYRWVALPLMHYFRLGQLISHEQAAVIIGEHFSDVKDKLLNILQLKQQSNNAIYAELINASINQKSNEIKLVPFKAAIDLGRNRKYLRYALPPVLMLLFLLFGAPNILREGSKRLWNSNTKYERPAPFHFLVDADTLRAVQFSDFLLKVKVEGQALPNEMFIRLGNVQYRLNKDSADLFSYKFMNLQKDMEFNLFAGGLESDDYKLLVARKPSILSFDVKLKFPEYIGRSNEDLANVGDLVIPQGTTISWVFNAQNTDDLSMRFGFQTNMAAKRFDDELFSVSRRAMQDETYKVFLRNAALSGSDSIAYTIAVIPDLHPQISVEEFKDSTSGNKVSFFAGDASDDYGLSSLAFNYQVKRAKGGQQPLVTVKMDRKPGKQIQYEYSWDVRNLELQAGDEVSYYFEVLDNDGVNGAKSARTNVMQYRMATLDEFRQQQASNNDEINKELEKTLRESMKIQEEMKKLRDKVLQQKDVDWQTRKEMERLLQRQQQLQEQMKQAKQNFEENREQQRDFNKEDTELEEKQEKLEELMDKALSEEMKQLMEEIQKLLQEMNKDEMLEKMEQMQMNSEQTNKDLERLKELFKKLEVEQMLDQQIEKLDELAKEQDQLAKETEEKQKSPEDLKKEQDQLNKEFEDLQKQHEDLLKKNEELKRKEKVDDERKEMNDTKQEMKDASEDLQQNDSGGASKKQKKAANKMKNMANKMKQGKQKGKQKQMEEDAQTLRQILENLVTLSYDQEKNLKEVGTATVNTPRYVELAQDQFKIKEDFKLVEDSLQALANRNFDIESIINEKVTDLKASLKFSIEGLEERQVNIATEQQQRSMKTFNDLALLFSEALQNMQMKMGNMPGAGSCPKPGEGEGEGKQGKVPKDKPSQGQESLNKQMQGLKERLEKQGKNGSSKEFAQMAAQQAALRNALRQMQKEKQEKGKGSKTLDQIMEEMNKVEIDLVNKRLSNETMRRQQDILTRLLEEERAEREREQDDKREAQTARQQQPKVPPALEEYLKKRRAEIEQFRTVSPALKPYYKQLVEEYLKGSGGK